jgi:Arc/MetJ-type ribon-helix-helix transcriptional regulator
MVKMRKNVTIDDKILEWIDKQIEKKRFASVSHAIEYAVQQLIEKEKKEAT